MENLHPVSLVINIMYHNSTKIISVGIKPWLQALSCPKKTMIKNESSKFWVAAM